MVTRLSAQGHGPGSRRSLNRSAAHRRADRGRAHIAILGRILDRGRRAGRDPVARDTVWGAGFDALQLSVMLLSFALLGKQLGPAGFGSYAGMYAIIGILGGISYIGVSLAVVQHLVRDRHGLTEVLSACLGLVVTAGLTGAALGTVIGSFAVPDLSILTLACFMLAELVGTATIEILASAVYARDGVVAATRYRIVPLLTKLAVLLGLFFADALTISALGIAYVLLYPVIAVLLARSVSRRYSTPVRVGRPQLDYLRSSGLYAVTISAMSVQNDADKVVLTGSRSGADAGLYAAAYRLVLLGMVPLRALLGASHRRFLEHDPTLRNQHVRRALAYSSVGAAYGVVFGIGLFLAAPLVTLLLGPEYEGAVVMLRALAPIVLIRSFAEFGLNGLLGLGRVGVRMWATVAAAATALVLYLTLIPRLGWEGAVIGTYASEVLLGVIAWSCLLYYQRRHNTELATGGGQPERPDDGTVSARGRTSEGVD